jgi:hypothetical protein
MPQLEASVNNVDFVVLRKINITDWKTPVVRQYSIRSIPHCMIFDPKGTLKESSSRACWLLAQQPEDINKL